jgi:glyoxylase-like metal-dependent hydrolase (beta-lactamase superfamily II)
MERNKVVLILTLGRLLRCCLAVLAFVLVAAPAMAQVDFVGEWEARYHEDQPERLAGPSLGDYLGLPINDAARMRADSWDASIQTLPEWQCRPHPADYGTRGPANVRIWKDVDPITQRVVAYHTHVQWQAQERTIWMDGRPHPPEDAPHSWQGFSTGTWKGNSLEVTTTHLKESYLRRNGVPRSDLATLVEVWSRHGDFLTLASMVDDPVYLTEPMIRTTNWAIAPQQSIDPYPCEVGEEVTRAAGDVPHHLPGTNPFLGEYAKKNGLPEIATRGGAATMYPEYAAVLKGKASGALPPPTFATSPPAGKPAESGVHVQKVQGAVYMLSSPSGNITMQIGDDGVLLVDAGPAAMTAQVLAEVGKLSKNPIRYIVNTDFHPDHTGGNKALFEEGETIAGGDVVNLVGQSSKTGGIIIGHENVVLRMTQPKGGGSSAVEFGSYPTDSYAGARKDLFLNNEGIRILHEPKAHTDGDSIVFFRRSDVISTGDVFTTTGYPQIAVDAGGTIQGEINALNAILDLTIPAGKAEAGTYIVPGYGRLSDMADVAYYRDMVTIVRDRILDMKKKGMSLEQVKAARPTRDYDGRWGSTTGSWTTDMFVEAVYRTVDATPATARR